MTFTPDELRDIGFMCHCYLDDLEKNIKKDAKSGKDMQFAKELHAQKTRLVYTKIIPDSLSGDLLLLDGTTLRKER